MDAAVSTAVHPPLALPALPDCRYSPQDALGLPRDWRGFQNSGGPVPAASDLTDDYLFSLARSVLNAVEKGRQPFPCLDESQTNHLVANSVLSAVPGRKGDLPVIVL